MKNHYRVTVGLNDEKMREVELVSTLCKLQAAAVEQ